MYVRETESRSEPSSVLLKLCNVLLCVSLVNIIFVFNTTQCHTCIFKGHSYESFVLYLCRHESAHHLALYWSILTFLRWIEWFWWFGFLNGLWHAVSRVKGQALASCSLSSLVIAGLLQLTRLLFFSVTQVGIVCQAMCSRHCEGERKLEEKK